MNRRVAYAAVAACGFLGAAALGVVCLANHWRRPWVVALAMAVAVVLSSVAIDALIRSFTAREGR